MSTAKSETRIDFRLSRQLKQTIEDAAAAMGLSVSDFAVSTLVQSARKILQDRQVTRLSDRDRRQFASILDGETSKPNDALVAAVKLYKKQVR